MSDPLDSFEKALGYALTLPGTARTTSYGKPAAAVGANGRSFLHLSHEGDTSFAVALDLDSIEMLKETEPETYWQSPHYAGYPMVLVRYDSPDPERVRRVLAQARDQAGAKRPVRKRKR